MSSGATISVPTYVTQAIRDYVPRRLYCGSKAQGSRGGFIILDWGVRVSAQLDGKEYAGWICLGSHECRLQNRIIQLYGSASKATKHLSEEHLLTATKVTVENERKRGRAEQLRSVIVTGDNSRRINLPLETMRVVNNNLPF
ncbi:hypothetical protein GN958_ATG04026 [Phytophthora infestans]|uniref:Uncharacterized protein n=1 Tax=Phytophthora infestans TaxID=4787 RepID=A0A8S9V5T1_PHYIN|nr:hypothetical protein GN958_ATG04026 [Phytophthora infestans]